MYVYECVWVYMCKWNCVWYGCVYIVCSVVYIAHVNIYSVLLLKVYNYNDVSPYDPTHTNFLCLSNI